MKKLLCDVFFAEVLRIGTFLQTHTEKDEIVKIVSGSLALAFVNTLRYSGLIIVIRSCLRFQ